MGAFLRFPYEPGGFMTVCVDDIISVVSGGGNIATLVSDINMGGAQEMNIKLEYKDQAPTADDLVALQAAIVEASQKPGSCNIFKLAGDDGSDADYWLKSADGVTVVSA